MGEILSDFGKWLVDVLLWVPRTLWAELLEGLSGLIAAIPVPGFVTTAQSAFASIPSSVLFFLDKFEFSAGIAMIMSAYVLRFVIRRIPLIG
ncbi:hypothetical protein D3C78_449880 [compost metagenome]